jgi:hypothetical protein
MFTRSLEKASEPEVDKMTWLEFSSERVNNPLKFLEIHSCEKAPSMLRSAWILQQLASGNF